MTREQVLHIFDLLRVTPTDVVVQHVTVLLQNGDSLGGEAYPPSTDGLLQVNVPRIADAHILKGPLTVFVDVAAIQAISTDVLATPGILTAGKTAESEEPVKLETEGP